jgi:hypothetical protein
MVSKASKAAPSRSGKGSLINSETNPPRLAAGDFSKIVWRYRLTAGQLVNKIENHFHQLQKEIATDG